MLSAIILGSSGVAVRILPLFGIRKPKRVPSDFDLNQAWCMALIWLSDAEVEHLSSTGSPKEPNFALSFAVLFAA